jgi:c-di-GMP-binding flagellar brake protein YcgR
MPSSTPRRAPKPIDRRRRRHPRYRADFRLSVNHLQGDHYQKIEGHCRDVSQAGIGILLATELNIGDVASLNVSFPGSASTWELRAVVRYRRGYQYGFEFLSLNAEQKESLAKFLQGLEQIE